MEPDKRSSSGNKNRVIPLSPINPIFLRKIKKQGTGFGRHKRSTTEE